MMRILLFLATNIAVLLVASITLRLLGVESYLRGQGINFTSLLIFCFVFGMAGSIVSLFALQLDRTVVAGHGRGALP